MGRYGRWMFTGLIQHVGRVNRLEDHPAGLRLVIDPLGWDHAPAPGDSIAVSGVCLTIVEGGGEGFAFDVVHETLAKTTLGTLKAGSRINLEHAARADTLMGGHVVQGHIDCLARVHAVSREGDGVRMAFSFDGEYEKSIRAIVPKGSVAVEGVSLTIASVSPADRMFEVALIPTTLTKTTLGGLVPGDRVNLEMDMLAKTVVYWLKNFGER